jgi:hypothetical protein
VTDVSTAAFRRLRLAHGWDPVQLVGRLKLHAARDGVALPKVYLLLRLLFLWENRRLPIPAEYARLLSAVFDLATTSGRRQ